MHDDVFVKKKQIYTKKYCLGTQQMAPYLKERVTPEICEKIEIYERTCLKTSVRQNICCNHNLENE